MEEAGKDSPRNSPGNPGRDSWRASLELRFERKGARTVMGAARHLGPLRVQRPFYPESGSESGPGSGLCHTYLLHPPGGMVGGDQLRIDVDAGAGAEVLLTTPAAGKFYRSLGQQSQQRQRLSVAAGACCEWLPQENILFDGALSLSATDVELAPGARFIGWEIGGLGRPAAEAPYRSGRHDQRFAVYRDGRLFYTERIRLDGDRGAYRAAWGLRGRCVSATLIATPADADALAAARSLTAARALDAGEDDVAACTLIEDVLLCRCLGDDMQSARRYMTRLWSILRPSVVGRAACPPRIWLT